MTEMDRPPEPSSDVLHTEPLLATKLYIPAVGSHLVPRPRLLEHMNQGLSGRLVLVSAPAGFGKTTLLAEWLKSCPRPAAWVALDAGDNDPVRFLRYVIAALQTVAPGVGGEAEEMLHAPQRLPVQPVLTSVINDLAALPPQDDRSPCFCVLALDDYNLIDSATIHEAITFLLDHLPSQLCLAIATRADPPWPLSRWRSRGQLIEVRTDDLRFTAAETAELLNQVMGLGLSAEDVAALEARTEGWVVGLQMAVLSMQGRQDLTRFVQAFSGSHRFILDYLTEEVLERQQEDVQTFLLHTSILERLSGALCDAVTGQGGGQAMLEGLEKANLFLVPLDDERRWYRYHRLFSDLLRARFQQSQPALVSALRARAAEWCEDHGLVTEAVDYGLAAQDFERVARLVEQDASSLLARNELGALLSWLQALPSSLVQSRPWLCIYHAWALSRLGELDNVEPLLHQAEQQVAASAPGSDTQEILGYIALVRARVANLRGDMDRAREQAYLAREHLPDDSWVAHDTASYQLGYAHYASGDLVTASQVWNRVAQSAMQVGDLYTAVSAMAELIGLHKIQGQLHRAADLYQQIRLWTEQRGGQYLFLVGILEISLGELLYEWNDLEGAHHWVSEGIHHAQMAGRLNTLSVGHATLARILLARGDVAGAAVALEKAQQFVKDRYAYPRTISQMCACRIRLWLAQSNLPAACQWMQENRVNTEAELGFACELEHMGLVRLLIARAEYDRAVDLAAWLAQAAEAGGRNGRLVEILVLQAVALHAQHRDAEALAVLEKSLSLAEPEGYVRTFVDEGAPVAELLRLGLQQRAWGDPRLVEYANRLLAAFTSEVVEQTPSLEAETSSQVYLEGKRPLAPEPPGELVEPLSERECEVLCLLADGLSNQEIAQELVLAVGTVKAHIHNIYGKLGVQSRVQAVTRARELGLL